MKMIGQRIKLLRVQLGMTQQELASLVGVTRGQLAKWESSRVVPRISNLQKLAEVLHVKFAYFLEEGNPLNVG